MNPGALTHEIVPHTKWLELIARWLWAIHDDRSNCALLPLPIRLLRSDRGWGEGRGEGNFAGTYDVMYS